MVRLARASFVLLVLATLPILTNCVPSELCAWQPGESCDGTIQIAGVTRHYRLHVPRAFRPFRPKAVVFGIHGFRGQPEGFERGTGLSAKADQEGFIVVYPKATELSAGTTFWPPPPANQDDLAFVARLLEMVQSTFFVDPRRVYATGASNGGGMTEVLGCTMADRFAAVAPVIAADIVTGVPCEPGQPVPAIFVFGEEDALVPWPNGVPGFIVPPPEQAEMWAARNGTTEFEEVPGEAFDLWTWRTPGQHRRDVQLYLVHGAGHEWPHAEVHGIEATDVIWSFFESHPRRRGRR